MIYQMLLNSPTKEKHRRDLSGKFVEVNIELGLGADLLIKYERAIIMISLSFRQVISRFA
jgi:hypothetical protein